MVTSAAASQTDAGVVLAPSVANLTLVRAICEPLDAFPTISGPS